MKTTFLAFSCCIMLIATPALAYRPFYTEDAGVAGKGVLQTEISWDYFKWKNGDIDQIYLLVTPIYGPTEDIELSMEIPHQVHIASGGPTTEGLGDINLVAKYVLVWENYEKKDALLTLKGLMKLNSGDSNKGLGRGDTEYSLFPVFTKIITKTITINGQLGYTFVTDAGDANLRNFAFYGMAVDYALTDPLHLMVEYTGNQNPDRTQVDQKLSLFGLSYTLNNHLCLDTSYKKGLSHSTPDWGIGIGASIQF